MQDIRQLKTLLPLTEKLIGFSRTSGNHIDLLRNLCLKALVLDQMGQTAEAMSPLHQAFEEAKGSGVVEKFLYHRRLMQDLLEKALSYGKFNVEIRRLLMAFPEVDEPVHENDHEQSVLVEALTRRESEVLQLVAEGLSNKDIQERLTLTKNTVRTHLRNLYGKLGASSRTQAVHKARMVGLLE